MIKYLKDLVSRFQDYGERLNNFSLLVDQSWIVLGSDPNDKCVYIFKKKNNKLLILTNGVMAKEDGEATWDYIASINAIEITRKDETRLYYQGFFDDSLMILRLDGTDQFQAFVNENKISTSIQDLISDVKLKYEKIEEHVSGGKTDNKGINIHHAPEYEEEAVEGSWSVIIGQYSSLSILFSDGVKGKINLDKEGNYFIMKGAFLPKYIVYEDKTSCINGLHYLLKYNKVLRYRMKELFN